MDIDKEKLKGLLWAEAASYRADCADWKRNTEALDEFLGDKTVGEVALELLAESDRLASVCERAEQVINTESKAAAIATGRANLLLAERDQLKAENERLAANVKLNLCDHPAIHQGDVDLLVAFVTGTSQMELAKVHGCTPPNISRKIRRVKERLGWCEGMLVSEIRNRAEQLRALALQGAVVTAGLIAERDQLRAEVAGLKTGYEAYERVNAELKAEVERLSREYEGKVLCDLELFETLRDSANTEADEHRQCMATYRPLRQASLDSVVKKCDELLAALGQGEQS